MAPTASESRPMYQKDEKALCFHGELLYEAKVLEVRRSDSKDKNSVHEYRVHYKGWKNTWDDWVPQDRLRKLTDDNKELANNLRRELTQAAPKSAIKPATSKSRKQGSEFGSGRGSEERHSSVPAGGRGTKRGRDNDIEKVGGPILPLTRDRLLELEHDTGTVNVRDSNFDKSIPLAGIFKEYIDGIPFLRVATPFTTGPGFSEHQTGPWFNKHRTGPFGEHQTERDLSHPLRMEGNGMNNDGESLKGYTRRAAAVVAAEKLASSRDSTTSDESLNAEHPIKRARTLRKRGSSRRVGPSRAARSVTDYEESDEEDIEMGESKEPAPRQTKTPTSTPRRKPERLELRRTPPSAIGERQNENDNTNKRASKEIKSGRTTNSTSLRRSSRLGRFPSDSDGDAANPTSSKPRSALFSGASFRRSAQRELTYWDIDHSNESIDDILARPPPPDEPEYISNATWKAGTANYFAPLIGGTTHDEKTRIERELSEAGKMEIPNRYHPKYIKTRQEDPGNFNKLLFYEGVNPQMKLAIAGVPKDPLHIDPPGSKTPFDALKYPDRLVNQLNRDDEETLDGWDENALKKIPKELLLRLEPRILAKMPHSVLVHHQSVVDKLPSDAPFFKGLAMNSKLKRPEHRQSWLKRNQGESGKHKDAIDATDTAMLSPLENSRATPHALAISAAPPAIVVVGPEGDSDISPTRPLTAKDKCDTCVVMGVKCNGQKPKCFWCKGQGFSCSFENAEPVIESPPTIQVNAQPASLRRSIRSPKGRVDFSSTKPNETGNFLDSQPRALVP